MSKDTKIWQCDSFNILQNEAKSVSQLERPSQGGAYSYMRHVMRKPVYAICEQQRRRSACASAQSDQRLCCRCLDSMTPLVAMYDISSLYLASVAAQTGLYLTWSETPKTGFLVTWLNYLPERNCFFPMSTTIQSMTCVQ